MTQMTPQEIVSELDKHIIGQDKAKRAVAIALRNRWRRQQVAEPLRHEIVPKNILMIGPTGVGKTEIARRLARLANAPFIKIEATKFTEVGYVGKDVDSIIRDLMEAAIKEERDRAKQRVDARARDLAEERVLDALLPSSAHQRTPTDYRDLEKPISTADDSVARQKFRKRLREGELDDKEIEIDVAQPMPNIGIMGPAGMEELTNQLQGMMQGMPGKTRQRKMRIAEAMKLLVDEEAGKLVNDEEIKLTALANVEQNGIVFLDEIDKIAVRGGVQGGDVSRQGVQRDLLPLVEGTAVNTRYGVVKTDHILFIASGAFHLSKPSDLVPELQGRFPIRVELSSLSVEDFRRILTETDASLTKQYQALLATEGVTLDFRDDGINKLAETAFRVNEGTENIGARRLQTVMERLLEEVSFQGDRRSGETVVIDAAFVEERLGDIARNEVLARPVHPGSVFVEGDQERGVVVGAVVLVEERHPPFGEELLQHHMSQRHAEGRVGAGRDRHPLVGELGGFRVIGRHDHDLLAAVAGLDHPVGVGRTRQGHVRTPKHQVAGVPPVAGFTHVGLVAVDLRRGGRQVGVPVVEGQHAAAD